MTLRLERIGVRPRTERGRIVWLLVSLGSPIGEIADACRVAPERLRSSLRGGHLRDDESVRLTAWLSIVQLRLRVRRGVPVAPEERVAAWYEALVAGLAHPPPPLDGGRNRGA